MLLKVRASVRHGTGLLEALRGVDAELLHREFARHELIARLPFGLTLEAVAQATDLSLLVLERAIARCTHLRSVGGWSVTRKETA